MSRLIGESVGRAGKTIAVAVALSRVLACSGNGHSSLLDKPTVPAVTAESGQACNTYGLTNEDSSEFEKSITPVRAEYAAAVDKQQFVPPGEFTKALAEIARTGTIDPKPSIIGGTFVTKQAMLDVSYNVNVYYREPRVKNGTPLTNDQLKGLLPTEIHIFKTSYRDGDLSIYDGAPLGVTSSDRIKPGVDGKMDTVAFMAGGGRGHCINSLQDDIAATKADIERSKDHLPEAQQLYMSAITNLADEYDQSN